MVAKAHLADLPLRIARVDRLLLCPSTFSGASIPWASIIWCRRTISAWICAFSQLSVSVRPRPLAMEEEMALPGLADGRDGDSVDRVELEDRHQIKGTVDSGRGFDVPERGKKIKVDIEFAP